MASGELAMSSETTFVSFVNLLLHDLTKKHIHHAV